MIKITDKQIEYLKQYIREVDRLIKDDDVNELLLAIDDAIIYRFDNEGNPDNEGIEMQMIYDDIYAQN